MTNEGIKAYDEAIKFMQTMKPVVPLQLNDALTQAAEFHTKDIGPTGKTIHDNSDGTSWITRL